MYADMHANMYANMYVNMHANMHASMHRDGERSLHIWDVVLHCSSILLRPVKFQCDVSPRWIKSGP